MSDANQNEPENDVTQAGAQPDNNITDATTPVDSDNQGSQPGDDDGSAERPYEKRIKSLLARAKEAEERESHWKSVATRFAQLDDQSTANQTPGSQQPPQTPTQNGYSPDEVDRAAQVLRQKGFVTKEEIQAQFEQMNLRRQWDDAHARNERQFNKSNAKYPEYNREEVEDYARQHNIGDPTAAYRNMYFDEILDAARQESRTRSGNSNKSTKPGAPDTEGKQPLTVETFRQKLSGPDGRAYYDELAKDPAKLDALLAQVTG